MNITGEVLIDMRSLNDGKIVDFIDGNHWEYCTPISGKTYLDTIKNDLLLFSQTMIYSYRSWIRCIQGCIQKLSQLGSTADFTISYWIYPITSDYKYNGHLAFYDMALLDVSNNILIGIASADIQASYTSINIFDGDSAASHRSHNCFSYNNKGVRPGSLYHIAFTRSNQVIRCFINGQLIDTSSYNCVFPNNITQISFMMELGTWKSNIGNYVAYFQDFVFIKDQALWTDTFTPPTDFITGNKVDTPINSSMVIYTPSYNINKKLKQY